MEGLEEYISWILLMGIAYIKVIWLWNV